MSKNDRMRWDISQTEQLLGYVSQDNAAMDIKYWEEQEHAKSKK